MRYRIYPPIGIARVGSDPEFFLTPEKGPGLHSEPDKAGDTRVTRFKSANGKAMRKQAVRFHIFQSEDGESWEPLQLEDGGVVEWSVSIENKKSAVVRPSNPPTAPTHPSLMPNSGNLHIVGGSRSISGANELAAPFVDTFTVDQFSADVNLGRLATDSRGRLIVMGGDGAAGAPAGTPIGGGGGTSYYRNPNWFDDVADGPVKATVRINGQSDPVDADPAWVVVGPPGYAPGIQGLVTMHDVLRQIGIDAFNQQEPDAVSYESDVLPIITRAKLLRWVHDDATWSATEFDSPLLSSPDASAQQTREAVKDLILSAESILEGHVSSAGPPYRIRTFQKQILDRWVAGDFVSGNPIDQSEFSPETLTRASLDEAVGQGFCPGIEAGILLTDPSIYVDPFDYRLDHNTLEPGDVTALMAQPWQADYLKCHTEWWPSQRPDLAPQSDGSFKPWNRGAQTHEAMVANCERLGVVVKSTDQEVFVEVERDEEL
ncbi:hypothetical protein RBSH_01579 [Rhodopirellula baltica SH28]|uniref:Uncharacterized protein n=1 Tax=Rhodopirellula baltica SH28 TaxID=993517 RepID=K5EAN9_RHOBT|nr:LodA/GoxA family CTQ-dependent oxidase [Rhodopirellula baltica]EKK02886.1 hypothetical protein RBSH_01579 [Rhodopirellula baltica SH28]